MKSALSTLPTSKPNTYILDLKDIHRLRRKIKFSEKNLKVNVSNPQSLETGNRSELLYDTLTLKLLDFLKCPILLLPLYKGEQVPKKIGFFTDLRSTAIQSIALLKEMIKSLNCDLIIINISDNHQPPINKDYAELLFSQLGLATINEIKVKLINPESQLKKIEFEAMLIENHIDLLAVTATKKRLLYNFI